MRSPPAAAELSPMAVHGVAQTRAAVLGLGAYAPPKVLTNDDLARLVDTSDEWITTRTGIKRRHVAGPNQATSDLAVIAAQQALDAAAVRAQDLDLIVVGTATPDMLFPATACLLQERLGAPQAGAVDLLAACSSFVYGLISAGWTMEHVDLIVPHQANLRIIEAMAAQLHLPMEKFVVNIQEYGNTSAASVPLALFEAVQGGRIHDDDRIVLAAFGGGFTYAACALVWGK